VLPVPDKVKPHPSDRLGRKQKTEVPQGSGLLLQTHIPPQEEDEVNHPLSVPGYDLIVIRSRRGFQDCCPAGCACPVCPWALRKQVIGAVQKADWYGDDIKFQPSSMKSILSCRVSGSPAVEMFTAARQFTG
jgi:hypothetical protein